ncbi:PilZ domain-containing protein [Cellulomonas endophytica]|uniref:PilZ domain-containing protein n=1 Tax=Cellulomonas endophytica TaxID=2494735 RepID=UPI001F0C0B83|nr:PilZ domain-containing protein [Cellulomonas endophytica]
MLPCTLLAGEESTAGVLQTLQGTRAVVRPERAEQEPAGLVVTADGLAAAPDRGLTTGRKVRLRIASAARGLWDYAGVVDRVDDGEVVLREVVLVRSTQLRSALRIPVGVTVPGRRVRPPAEGAEGVAEPDEDAATPDEDADAVRMVVVDLSADGVRVVSRPALAVGDEVDTHIPEARRAPGGGLEPLPVRLLVVRSAQHGDVEHHGCRIVGLDAKDREHLHAYVARVERDRRSTAAALA